MPNMAAAEEVGLWQRVVMGLAGLMLLVVGGVLFETWGKLSLDYYRGFWGGFSPWGIPFVIFGLVFGVAAAVPPIRVLRLFLVAVGILGILVSAGMLGWLGLVVSVCACD